MSGPLSAAGVFQIISGKILGRRRESHAFFQESFHFVKLPAFGQSPSEVVQEMVIVWIERQGARRWTVTGLSNNWSDTLELDAEHASEAGAGKGP
jgi:hypothetical protein